jgi:flagellar motility protein MotE (MotC chaperone)
VKKAIIIAALALGALVMFAVSLVAVVRVRGGLDPSHALARAPLVGRLLSGAAPQAQAGGSEQTAEVAPQAGREAPFLRFGLQARLERLADELEAKKAEYDAAMKTADRRQREMDAWSQQLKEERDALRARFGKENEDLSRLRDDLARREAELASARLRLGSAEQANLKITADMYSKMEPEKAAELLTQLCADGKADTAVKILYLMQDRSAAKTLEAVKDPKTGAEMTERLQRVTKDAPPGG